MLHGITCALLTAWTAPHVRLRRGTLLRMSDTALSACSVPDLAVLASRAADAMSNGRALVEPLFLSDNMLEANRADMARYPLSGANP